MQRIYEGATGKFIPDDLTRPRFEVSLTERPKTAAAEIDVPELIEKNGGSVKVLENTDGRLTPATTLYPVLLKPVALHETPNQIIRGVVHLDATSQSIAGMVWQSARRIILRESVF